MGQKDPVKLYTTDNLVGRDPHEYIFVVLDLIKLIHVVGATIFV